MESLLFCATYIMLFVFTLLFEKRNYRTYRTPITFFSILWCIVGFVSNLGLMEFYKPSLLVNVCMVSGIIVFTISYMGFVKPKTIVIQDEFIFSKNEVVNYQLIYIFAAIGFVFLIPDAINSFRLINRYGMAFLRANLTNTELGISKGGIWDIITTYGISPIFTALSTLSCVLIFSDQPKKKVLPLFFVSVVSMVFSVIANASRHEFVRFFFTLTISLLMCRRQTIRAFFKNRLVRRGLIIAVFVVLFITFQRSISDSKGVENIVKSFYVYYFSGPSYLSQILENVKEYGPGGQLLWGSATFGFLTNFVSFALIFFTGRSQGSLYLLGSVLTNVQYQIGAHNRVNAMSTCYYNFLLDWSYFGIIIGPIILARMAAYFTKRLYRSFTIRDMCLYITFLYVLFRTCFKLDLVSISYTMTCLYIVLFCRRIKAMEE